MDGGPALQESLAMISYSTSLLSLYARQILKYQFDPLSVSETIC